MIVLRRAMAEDAQAIAIVHRTAMRVSLSFLPELHTADEDLRFFAERFLPANTVWVAESGGGIAGYIGFDHDWIHHLYVAPAFQGQGVGPRLLALALADGHQRHGDRDHQEVGQGLLAARQGGNPVLLLAQGGVERGRDQNEARGDPQAKVRPVEAPSLRQGHHRR